MTAEGAIITVFGLALLYDVAMNLIFAVIIPPEEYNRKRQIVLAWNREMRKALLNKDKKKIAELKKKERIKDEADAALAVASLKLLLVSLGLFWLILFYVLPMFSAATVILPFELPFIGDRLGYVGWFIFVTIALSSPARRAVGFR